jgi:hypothetical protein
VNWSFLAACELLHPTIRSDWQILLRGKPTWDVRAAPGSVADLMDSILDQLWSIQHTSTLSNWIRRKPSVPLPAWTKGGCGLDPLLVFMTAGKRALLQGARTAEATQADLPASERTRQRDELALAFDVIAQREIERVCGACARRKACAFGEGPPPAKRRGRARLRRET